MLTKIQVSEIDMEVKDGFIRSLKVHGTYQLPIDRSNKIIKARELFENYASLFIDDIRNSKLKQKVNLFLSKESSTDYQQIIDISGQDSIGNRARNICDSLIEIAGKGTESACFENIYGIGFSCRTNFKGIQYTKIYDNNHGSNYIFLGELITYIPELAQDRLDFSPANGLIKWRHDDDSGINVYKDKQVDLFDLKIYSDLKGFTGNSANGLVQLEFSKKIPLWTHRWKCTGRTGIGIFQYTIPFYTLNKLENSFKVLNVDTMNGKQFVSVTDAYLHRVMTGGVALNLINWEIQSAKVEFQLDAIAELSYLKVLPTINSVVSKLLQDTMDASQNINMLSYGGKVSAEFFPDNRYGFKVSYQFLSVGIPNRALGQNEGIQLVNNKSEPSTLSYRQWLNSIIMEGSIYNFNEGKIFGRISYNFSPDHAGSNFAQFQVGVRKSLITYLKEKK